MSQRLAADPAATVPSPGTDAAHLDAWHQGGHTDLDRTIPGRPATTISWTSPCAECS